MKLPFELILHGVSLLVRVAELLMGVPPKKKKPKWSRKPKSKK